MVTTGLLNIIKDKYNLEITGITEHRGYVNTVYGLKTKGGPIVYLRGYNSTDLIMREKTANEIVVLNFVKEHSNDVQLDFIIADNNHNQEFKYRGSIYTLRQELPGKPSNHGLVNSAKRKSTGKLLGYLHNALEIFPTNSWHIVDYRKYFLPIVFHLSPGELTTLINQANSIALKINTSASRIWKQHQKNSYKYIDRYCELRKNIVLPIQVIHGDLDPTNVTFIKDRAVGFMDWDFLQKSPRIMDLANSMINRPNYKAGDGEIKFDIGEVEELIEGYQETVNNKLSLLEINSIPLAFYNMGLQYLLTAGFLFSKNIPDEKLTNFLAFRFAFMDKLENMGNKWFKL